MSDIAYTLLYRRKDYRINEIEDVGYIWSFGDNSCAYRVDKDIKQAVCRENPDSFTNTIIGEYETHSRWTGFGDEIRLVTVSGKWSHDKFKFDVKEIINIGEDLLQKYADKKKELEAYVNAIEINLPMATGYSYLIRTREDLVKLQEYYPLLDELDYKLYGHEEFIKEECDYDEEKYIPKINEYRENFFVCGNMCESDLHVPLIMNRRNTNYKSRDLYNISIYSIKEIEEQAESYLKTINKIKNLIKEV